MSCPKRARARGPERRSSGSAGPRASPGRCRDRRGCGRQRSLPPRSSSGSHARRRRGGCRAGTARSPPRAPPGRRRAAARPPTETSPTGNVKAESATNPSRETPTSTDRMSPSASVRPLGDPVHDHLVRGRADGGRVAAVALEGRRAALRADELVGELVELRRRHARPHVLAHERERVGDDAAGLGHRLDLGRGLADDHEATRAWSRASWISAKTSSSGRSPWIPTRLPSSR